MFGKCSSLMTCVTNAAFFRTVSTQVTFIVGFVIASTTPGKSASATHIQDRLAARSSYFPPEGWHCGQAINHVDNQRSSQRPALPSSCKPSSTAEAVH